MPEACVLDTDVVIAALDRSDAHHAEAVAGISKILDGGPQLLISTINYAEALVRPAERGSVLQEAVKAIGALGIAPVAPPGRVAISAAQHRGLGVSLADGFALATAQAANGTIASFDQRVRRAAERLGIPLAF